MPRARLNTDRVVTEAAMARSTDAKPLIAKTPDPPRVQGGNETLASSAAPPEPSIAGVQAREKFKAGTERQLTLAIGVWTGAIAAVLCLTLLAGAGYPVGPPPDPEPGNPPPTKAMEFAWLATKGTAWVVRRSTDLVPSLLAMAYGEWRAGRGAARLSREGAEAELAGLPDRVGMRPD